MPHKDAHELALKELELLEDIIGRYESHFNGVRGWLLVVIGALIAGLYAKDVHLTPLSFFIVGFLSIVCFFAWESGLHSVHRAAIDRVVELENFLRSNSDDVNQVMLIATRLGQAKWKVGLKDMGIHFHWSPYAVLTAVIIFVGATAPEQKSDPPVPPPAPAVVQYFNAPTTAPATAPAMHP